MKKRYSEERIVRILREYEQGRSIVDLARENSVSDQTIYRWKRKFSGMEVTDTEFRDECLSQEIFVNLVEVRVIVENWRWLYNEVRPHSSLADCTLKEFAVVQNSFCKFAKSNLDSREA